MDDMWHAKSSQGVNRNSSQPSASLNQFEMNPGQFGQPYVQQEVCVIERTSTIRQEPLGANLLNFGLQGPSIKSVRGDVGNSLLALVPGSQQHFRPSYQPAASPRSTFSSSNLQSYQVGSGGSPNLSWPEHLSNISSGSRVSNGGSRHGADSPSNMFGREVNFSMLGRELNLAQYSRMAAGQDSFEASLLRASGVEMLKQTAVHDNTNDVSGQGPFPQWLTEIVSRRQRAQNMQSSPMLSSGGSFPRITESARDVTTGMSCLPSFAPSSSRGARVVCTNYDTGQGIEGELCVTQLGLFGVLCACHGSHMSVAKFTQHVGIYSANPGNVVVMDGSGESLVMWRRMFFSQFGVKVPDDNQGWDWSDGDGCESGPNKFKAVVTQSWQKEVDVSYSGEPVLKSRVTEVWDASLSPGNSGNYHAPQTLGHMNLPTHLGQGPLQDSRENFMKSFGRAFRGSSMDFGSRATPVDNLSENRGRSHGSSDLHSHLGPTPPGEFFNFISGSQQFVSTRTEQQVAVEHQISVGSRSLLKGLDSTWKNGREPLQLEKDNSLSSFELRLGQPSQQSQPVGASSFSSDLASQMRSVMQRVMDTRRQQDLRSTNGSGVHAFSGHLGSLNEGQVNNHHHQNFERTSYGEPTCRDSPRVDLSRGLEGSESALVDHPSFGRIEDVSSGRFAESLSERENILNRDAGQFSAEGVRRWSNAGNAERTFKAGGALLVNQEQRSKQWDNEVQHCRGSEVHPLSQGRQELDTILGREWVSKSHSSQLQDAEVTDRMDRQEGQASQADKLQERQGNCEPSCLETSLKEKDQLACGDSDTLKGTRDRQDCLCVNCGKSTSAVMEGRTVSKVGERLEFSKEDEAEENQVEDYRQRISRDASPGGSTPLDCNSPRVRRLRSFRALTSRGCLCGVSGVEEPSNQGSRVVLVAGGDSLVDDDLRGDKRFGNSDRGVAKSGLREAHNETFQWKEMGGIFVPGSETLADATHDGLLPAPACLEEDLLADTAAKINPAGVVSSGVSDKQQPLSDICSKSSENVLSVFSDGTGAEEEVSTAQSVDKNPIVSEVVDEGSGIGKCSSSDGVDMGLPPNLITCSKDDETEKLASSASQGYPSFKDTDECLATKVGTRSRGGCNVKEPVARNVEEDVHIDTGKVGKKRRRTMKWKRLDAAIGDADAKRQKPSTGSVAEIVDPSQKSVQVSDISNGVGNRNLVEISPSICGRPGTVKPRKIIVTHGTRGSLHSEPATASNAGNGADAVATNELYLKNNETVVMRVPQGLTRKKAKRSGRTKPVGKRVEADILDKTTADKSTALDRTIRETPTIDNSSIKESVTRGSNVPESGGLSTTALAKHIPMLNVQPEKNGRVVLGRPSPCSSTRMVSLNDIMNKPDVRTKPARRDKWKAVVVNDSLKSSAPMESPKSPVFKEGSRPITSKDVEKQFAVKDGLKAFSLRDRVKRPFLREGVKASVSKNGPTVSGPKESFQCSAPKEGLKVKVCFAKDGLKASPGKDAIKVSTSKAGLSISRAKDILKVPIGKDGLKRSLTKDSFIVPSVKESWTASIPKDGLMRSVPKAVLKESASKDSLRLPTVRDGLKEQTLKDGWKTTFPKKGPKSTAAKNDVRAPEPSDVSHTPGFNEGHKFRPPTDRLKLSAHQDNRNSSAQGSGLKNALLKQRLKVAASKDSSRTMFDNEVGKASASKEVPKMSAYNDGFKSSVSMDSLQASSRAKPEGKGPKKMDSGLTFVALSQDNQDKKSFLAVNAWRGSSSVTKSHKQDVRKVRSLHELIAEKGVPGPGAGVFDFHDEVMEPPRGLKKDLRRGTFVESEPTFSVPVHFSDSKCLIPRGERSPRGKFAKSKNVFWQKHNARQVGGGTLAAEPVEIVVGKSSVESFQRKTGVPSEAETKQFLESQFRPVLTRMRFPHKNISKSEQVDVTVSSAPIASRVDVAVSSVPMLSRLGIAKAVLNRETVEITRVQPPKRPLEQPNGVDCTFKKQKVLETPALSEPSSGRLKIKYPPPMATLAAASSPSIHVIDLEVKKDKKIKRQIVDEHLKAPGGKKQCQRSKWFDCRVPEGVVECCVCGNSVSEFYNQIVCCGRCPVKVHQACYGVKKIPNSAWFCRTCKVSADHPICVLCGYGGGAMTRAQKAKGFGKGLVKAWQEKMNAKDNGEQCNGHPLTLHENCGQLDKPEGNACLVENQVEKPMKDVAGSDTVTANQSGIIEKQGPDEPWMDGNTVTTGVLDSSVVQWVHMVCALWMPGTRCLNFGTMGVFDVSGVAQARRKLICSICKRKGGACIQCRVAKCGVPFHAWCAHEKGLLQSEIVEDGSDQVGFFGKCLRHGKSGDLLNDSSAAMDAVRDVPGSLVRTSTCARTQGYKGRLTLEQRAQSRKRATRNGAAVVSPEQVAAWLRINEKRTCKARRFVKSSNSDQKTDHREYLRFKQEHGWRRLSVYKSGIHALGLYTAEFIGRGEMVVEYIGEIVGLRVADKREADYHSGKRMQYQGACYLFKIDKERIIDATRKGGIARFVNHSCSPNCVAKVICVKNQSKVVFFAQRDIYAGEEITYDYQFNFEQEGDKIPCFCGSATCRGTLN